MTNKPVPPWSKQTRVIVVVVLLVLSALLLYFYSAAIPPILFAVFLAYVLSPFVNRLEKNLRIRRSFAVLIVYATLFAVLLLLLFVGVPFLIQQLRSYNINTHRILSDLTPIFQFDLNFFGGTIHGSELLANIEQAINGLPESVGANGLRLIPQAFEELVRVMLTLMISIYLIQDSAQVQGWMLGKIPQAYREEIIVLRDEIDLIWSSFLRGQMTLALIVSAILTAESYALGLRFAPLMGILGGLMEFLPSVGHGIWFAVAVVLAIVFGSSWLPVPNWALLAILGFCHLVFTQFDLNYLIPRVIGRKVRLSPLVVLMGIVVGISIAGVWGVLLAAPTIATLRVLGRYINGHLVDQEPMTDEAEVIESLPPPDLRLWKKRSAQIDSRD
jgi:predicted PurR-regulated permease PerM